GTVLVHHKFDSVLAIVLSHGCPVIDDDAFHAISFMQQFVVIDLIKLNCVTLAGDPLVGAAASQILGVVMNGPSPEGSREVSAETEELVKEAVSPVHIVAV